LSLVLTAWAAHVPPVPPPPLRTQWGRVVYPLPGEVRLIAYAGPSVAVQVAPIPPPPLIVQVGAEV